jgi:hypothetical protein
LPPLPDQYDVFLNERRVSSLSRRLNLAFSFASTETDMEFPTLYGDHFVSVQGKTFHRIRPDHRSSPIRWILYDGFEANAMPRCDQLNEIPQPWLDALRSALQTFNSFARRLINLRDLPAEYPDAQLQILDDGAAQEVAALIRYDNTALNKVAPRSLLIRRAGGNRKQKIFATSALWEPLAYPLLFPHGTHGWHPDRSKCAHLQYDN